MYYIQQVQINYLFIILLKMNIIIGVKRIQMK